MHSTGSIIKTYCEKVRHYLDDPDLDAKYDDNYLVRFFLSSAMTDVISRVSQMSDAQILSSFQITVEAGTNVYRLPPAVAQVVRIGTIEDATGLFIEDLKPRNQFNPTGPGWYISGNSIVFQPAVDSTKTYTLVFVPSGDIMAHYVATGTGVLLDSVFTLPSTTTIGSLDKRNNAYQGSYLRIFGTDTTDECVITSHNSETRDLLLATAPINIDGSYSYEIVPFLMEPMIDAISISAAMRAGVGRKITQAHMQSLMLAYKQSIKTSYDMLSNMNGRVGKAFNGTTIDANRFYVGPSYSTTGGGGSTAISGGCSDCASEATLNLILGDMDFIMQSLDGNGIDGGYWIWGV